jgi:transcription elongation factor Elf1
MTLTCPRCAQGIVVTINANQYEVWVTCPRCGERIVVEVGGRLGITSTGVGPTEHKRDR